jgi:hypothetical protein
MTFLKPIVFDLKCGRLEFNYEEGRKQQGICKDPTKERSKYDHNDNIQGV